MKRIVALFLAICMMLSLVACSSGGTEETTGTKSAESETGTQGEVVTVLGDYEVTVSTDDGVTTYCKCQ